MNALTFMRLSEVILEHGPIEPQRCKCGAPADPDSNFTLVTPVCAGYLADLQAKLATP